MLGCILVPEYTAVYLILPFVFVKQVVSSLLLCNESLGLLLFGFGDDVYAILSMSLLPWLKFLGIKL